MRVLPAELCDVLVIEPEDNHSRSVAGTIRGLHLQIGRPQAKLVRVISGAICDVAVDVARITDLRPMGGGHALGG